MDLRRHRHRRAKNKRRNQSQELHRRLRGIPKSAASPGTAAGGDFFNKISHPLIIALHNAGEAAETRSAIDLTRKTLNPGKDSILEKLHKTTGRPDLRNHHRQESELRQQTSLWLSSIKATQVSENSLEGLEELRRDRTINHAMVARNSDDHSPSDDDVGLGRPPQAWSMLSRRQKESRRWVD